MKKIIYILFGMLVWWACEDEKNPLAGPEGTISEFTDSRDGKIYRCVTIGDQTWMAENLAYRLPLGSVHGCYTYREENLDTNRIEPIRSLFDDVVRNAITEGKISSDPLPETPFFSPASMVAMYLEYPGSAAEIVSSVASMVQWYPSMQAAVDILNQILAETKTETIGVTAQEYFQNAEEENDGYAAKYGLLYTYDAALKALPEGWRLPTDEDWKKLEAKLYMDGDELGLLEQWRGKQAGMLLKEENTGFGILYGGTRAYGTFNYGAPYMNKDMNAYFWSSSRIVQNDSVQIGIIRAVSRMSEGILRGTSNLTAAYSIRCIKE